LIEFFLIYSVFGELKAVRLPKKLAQIGSYRGFGFVDFVTKNDAKVRSLHSMILYLLFFLFIQQSCKIFIKGFILPVIELIRKRYSVCVISLCSVQHILCMKS
jgi:hypothetical protein